MALYELRNRGDTEALRTLLREADNPAVRNRAAAALGEVTATDDDAATDAIDDLVAAATDDDDPDVRAAAVDALDQIGLPALEELVSKLADVEPAGDRADWAVAEAYASLLDAPRPEVRMAAATVLGRVGAGGSAVTNALTDALEDADDRVRARAARALGRLADPAAAGALADALDADSVAVRREAATALGSVGGDRAHGALIGALDDEAAGVRRAATDAVGEFGRVESVDALADQLADQSEAVRRAATFSIVEVLSNAPTQRSHEVRESVVDELDARGDHAVVVPLADVLRESQQAHHRRNAAWLLGRIADDDPPSEAVDALIDALDTGDGPTGQFAATALAQMGGEVVVNRLIEVIDGDAGPETTAMAAFALGKVGGPRARERLDALVEETEAESVRRRAFSALSKLGGRA
ncbi:MAG: HEAT repeat domain-containing protein [Halobacteriaceae archaeon]